MIRNPGKSIRARLLDVARKQSLSNQLLIIRYLYERLLYRLSVSVYKDKFYLKGGVLLYVVEKEYARPTLDIDFLGIKIKNDLETVKMAFRDICSVAYEADAVSFDLETLVAEEINETRDYIGVRLSITAKLDTIKQPLKIDIGFGDVVIPAPQVLTYPSLMTDIQPVTILAYSLETVVAEKFQAMVELSVVNSRYKDFYDVYQILSKHKLDESTLISAIQATFENRGTPYTEDHPLFTTEFAADEWRARQWTNFQKKISQTRDLSFVSVMQLIREYLQPIYDKLKQSGD